MFGGYGIYKEGIIIALLDEGQLYFKSIPDTEPYYKSFGSVPFVYEGKLRPVKMSYWLVPTHVLDDQHLLQEWVNAAYSSALEAQKRKKPPKKRRLLV
jgi:DNA transformation protein